MSEQQSEPQECRIEFHETDVTRSTAIGFFIEMAVDDDEATVYADYSDDDRISNVGNIPRK